MNRNFLDFASNRITMNTIGTLFFLCNRVNECEKMGLVLWSWASFMHEEQELPVIIILGKEIFTSTHFCSSDILQWICEEAYCTKPKIFNMKNLCLHAVPCKSLLHPIFLIWCESCKQDFHVTLHLSACYHVRSYS